MIDAPLVSIGLPTHNGAHYLSDSLDSLTAQDYPDLEIIVSDNASTDRTREIVAEFVRGDSRVRYERLESAISGAQNFNRAFALSRGSLFMWAADDDRWDRTYVRRCVAALAERPEAVMASTGLRFIDPAGDVLDIDYSRYDNPDLGSDSVVERVRRLVRRGGWYQVYGLARRSALERTHLFQDVYGPDVVLVLELALLGPIVRVPETLFWYRRHPGRTEQERAERQGGIVDKARVMQARTTHLEESLTAAIRASALPPGLRRRLRLEVLRAFYLDDTPVRSRTRLELAGRLADAVAEREPGAVVKFGLARTIALSEELAGASRKRVRRLLRAR